MTYEEAVKSILPGRYRHFKGNEYEVIGIARHSEDESPMVVYRALYGEGGLWCRPASMWNEIVDAFTRYAYNKPQLKKLGLSVSLRILKRIVAHVHDECIVECPPSTTVEEICQKMSIVPSWDPGLILRADGYECPGF